MATLASVILRDIAANRPAAGTAGRLFYDTTNSKMQRDNGSSWDDVAEATGLSNPMTTTGDIVVGGASGVPGRLAIGAATTFLKGGTTPAWAVPPGTELDYVAFTAPVTVSATTDATANTVVTANAVSFDGSTVAMIEFYCPYITPGSSAGSNVIVQINEGATILGYVSSTLVPSAAQMNAPGGGRLRLTPTNASHTYSARAWRSTANGTVGAGAGGTGAYAPGFIRITKV